MMNFLRALAPSHATAKTRAVAVVPSRFEDSDPLVHLPAANVAATPVPDPAEDLRDVTRVGVSAREDNTGRPTPADRDVVIAAIRGPVATSPAPDQTHARSTSQPLDVRAAAGTLEGAERADHARPVPYANERLPFPRGAQPVGTPLPAPAAASSRHVVDVAEPRHDRGPLSSSAVAARVASRGETPPVIHVTIDRIDVRAPSAPERAESRPRPRSNATGSLSDYLRSRQTARPGGSS
jgi:hypothetical protein